MAAAEWSPPDEVEASEMRVNVELGVYETVRLPADAYALLPQVRNRVNGSLEELADSIGEVKIINQPDVVRMTPEQLTDHLELINSIWHTNATIDQYLDKVQADGFIYVVIAGHSRFKAVALLGERHPENRYFMTCKLHDIASSYDFLKLQLAENTYDKPSPERRAMAVVEMYLYGLGVRWNNASEFIDQEGEGLSKDVVLQAVGFANLPAKIRELVFDGKLTYSTGVALGRAAATIKAYVALKDPLLADKPDKLEREYRRYLTLLLEHINTNRLGSTKACEYITATCRDMREEMVRIIAEANGEVVQTDMMDWLELAMSAAQEQAEAYQRAMNKRLADALKHVAQTSIVATEEAIASYRALWTGEDDEWNEDKEAVRLITEGRARRQRFVPLITRLSIADDLA